MYGTWLNTQLTTGVHCRPCTTAVPGGQHHRARVHFAYQFWLHDEYKYVCDRGEIGPNVLVASIYT